MENIGTLLNHLADFSLLFVGLLALVEYRKKTKKERIERENAAFKELDDKYILFLQICLENIELDIFDYADQDPIRLDCFQKKKELISFHILFSIFERAFLMYQGQSDIIKRKQWAGWDMYIENYVSRKNFREAWGIDRTFDSQFVEYIDNKMGLQNTRINNNDVNIEN
jgi:hypothetical protein